MRKLFLSIIFLLSSVPAFAQLEAMPEGDREAEARGWTAWVNLGGSITSDPAACTAGNWTYVFARGTDNTVFYRTRYLPTGIWSAWRRLSTRTTTASPAAACTYHSNTNYKVDVFIAGTGGNIYHLPGSNGSWGSWQNIGGVADAGSGPAAAANVVGNRLEVFVRGTDHTLFRKYRYYGTWSGWTRVSSTVKSDPAVAMVSTSHFDVFAVAPSDQLWSRMWEGNLWYSPRLHAGVITSSPDAVSRQLGSLDVFARGPNRELLWKTQAQGNYGSWMSLGGVLTSGPGATTYASNARIFVFVRGTDGALYYRAWAP